jgi:hypothetical protein
MRDYHRRTRDRNTLCRRRDGRVFIGVADGWLNPADAHATTEDIEAHLSEIEDLSSYALPASSWDELRDIGRLRNNR